MTVEPGLVFNRVAEDYDRVRPSYPASLIDAACSIAGLGRGSNVVEVGCGTGKLTGALVERRPGGVLALLAYVGGSNLELELEAGFLSAWREVLPEAATWESRDAKTIWEGAEARRDNVSELWAWLEKGEIARPEAAELFEDVDLAKVPVEREESAAQLLAFVRTTSSYLRLDPGRQKLLEKRLTAVVEDAGGYYRSTTFATLVTARVPDSAEA